MTRKLEKLVKELAARVIQEMNKGHTFNAAFHIVVGQKWKKGQIPKHFGVTYDQLRVHVRDYSSNSNTKEGSVNSPKKIDHRLLADARAHEGYHRNRLGKDYE